MRLIDADALDYMLSEAQAECKRNGGNFRFGVLSNIRENIVKLPTIDAITVEWLREHMNPGMAHYAPAAYRLLMEEWQKEQEVR